MGDNLDSRFGGLILCVREWIIRSENSATTDGWWKRVEMIRTHWQFSDSSVNHATLYLKLYGVMSVISILCKYIKKKIKNGKGQKICSIWIRDKTPREALKWAYESLISFYLILSTIREVLIQVISELRTSSGRKTMKQLSRVFLS